MYQGVWLIDVASGTEEQIISDPVIAFFWSPDGRQLAYVTPVEIESGWVRWSVLNLETGRTVDLTPFRADGQLLDAFEVLRPVLPVSAGVVSRRSATGNGWHLGFGRRLKR